MEVAKPLIRDSFERTVAAGGWGPADQGGTWAMGGTASLASVAGGRGLFSMPAGPTVSVSATLTQSSRDVEVSGSAGFSAAPVGSDVWLRCAMRASATGVGVGTSYGFWVGVLASTGNLQVQFVRDSTTILQSKPIEAYVAGRRYNFRARVRGASPTILEARVWQVGTPEPTAWSIATSDATGPQVRQTFTTVASTAPGTLTGPVAVSVDDFAFGAIEPGVSVIGKAALDLDFGGTVVELECDATALEITPNTEEVDTGTYCEPVSTEVGRVTYSAVAALLWSGALYTKLEPHVGELATLRFYPEAADTSRYITFDTRYAALPWGRFELGQRVEVDLPLAVLTTPDYVGETP